MKNPLTTRTTGLNPLVELRREMDRLFDDFWAPETTEGRFQNEWRPACDVEEADDHYLMTVEMPGVSRDDVKIEMVDNQLVISGERKHEEKRKDGGLWYSERRFGRFQRSFVLPAGVNTDKLEAHYEDGILRLYIPKAETAKPRQIKISSGASSSGFFGKLLGQKEKETVTAEKKSDKVA